VKAAELPGARSQGAAAIPDPSRILLVCFGNIGDVVFTSALAPALRDRHPHVELAVWCKSYTRDVAALVPEVARVHAADPFWEGSPGLAPGRKRAYLRNIFEVRRERYPVALIVSSSWRAAAATALAGVRRRVGLRRRGNPLWLTHCLPPGDRSRPFLADLVRLLTPLGIPPRVLRARLERSFVAERGRELVARCGGGEFVALHPFAGSPKRCVALSEWRRLAVELVRDGASIVWIGSPQDLAEVRAGGGCGERESCLDEIGDGTVRDLAALLTQASLCVGHDSGPIHIASAFGVPVVGVYTPGEPRRTSPQGIGPVALLERDSPAGVRAEDISAVIEALRARTVGAEGSA
jgi:ADP-heptose:LPS heptosyltransferase